jgi:hypothetical protein
MPISSKSQKILSRLTNVTCLIHLDRVFFRPFSLIQDLKRNVKNISSPVSFLVLPSLFSFVYLAAKIGGASTEKKKAFFLFCVRLALSLPHEKNQRV